MRPSIFTAIHEGDWEQFQQALLDGDNVLAMRNRRGMSPLHTAAFYDRPRMLEALLALPDADPNVQTVLGQTALHFSISSRSAACLISLLNNNVQVEIPNFIGETSLIKACRSGSFTIFYNLLNLSRNQNFLNWSHYHLLNTATFELRSKYLGCLQELNAGTIEGILKHCAPYIGGDLLSRVIAEYVDAENLGWRLICRDSNNLGKRNWCARVRKYLQDEEREVEANRSQLSQVHAEVRSRGRTV